MIGKLPKEDEKTLSDESVDNEEELKKKSKKSKKRRNDETLESEVVEVVDNGRKSNTVIADIVEPSSEKKVKKSKKDKKDKKLEHHPFVQDLRVDR